MHHQLKPQTVQAKREVAASYSTAGDFTVPCLLLFQQLFGITHPLFSEENQVFLPKRWQKILDAGKTDGQEANCAPCKAAAVLALTQ